MPAAPRSLPTTRKKSEWLWYTRSMQGSNRPVTSLVGERYVLGPPIGAGGMADVYQARDRDTGSIVALKVLKQRLASRPSTARRFEQEVRFAAQIRHHNLVPLLDLGRMPDNRPFMVLPLASRGSLDGFHEDWEALHGYVDQVLAALGALHAEGVLHRDVKPSNVLLHEETAWLADLGIAIASHDPARDRSIAGTRGFMPPEQRYGQSMRIGRSSDLYAVGIMIRVLAADIVVPSGLDGLLEILCHPDSDARFDLAADVRRALAQLGPPDSALDVQLRTGTRSGGTTTPAMSFDETAPHEWEGPQTDVRAAYEQQAPPRLPKDPPKQRHDPRIGSAALLTLARPPLVGRQDLRHTLWTAARTAAAERLPRALLLHGPRGAGKRRLVRWLSGTLEQGGWAEPLWITPGSGNQDGLAGAARRLLRRPHPPGAAEARDLVSRLERDLRDQDVGMVAALARAWTQPSEPEPAAAAALLRAWLASRAWRGVALVLVPGLQDAEPPVRAFLDALLDDHLPLLIVATQTRADGPADWTRLPVAPLGEGETTELMQALLPLERELASAAAHRCAGNPLFAQQMLRHWAQSGMLRRQPDGTHTLAEGFDPDQTLPSDTTAIWEQLRDGLEARKHGTEVVRALQILSLVPEPSSPALFQALAGAHTASAARTGWLVRQDEAVTWAHPLLREAVAASIRDPEPLHAAIATALLDLPASEGIGEGALGLHLQGAGRSEQAREHLCRGCLAAIASQDVRKMKRLGDALLDADASGGAAATAHWTLSLVAQTQGEPAEALTHIEQALGRLDGSDPELANRVHLAHASLLRTAGDLEAATAAAKTALQGAPTERAAGRAHHALAVLDIDAGRPDLVAPRLAPLLGTGHTQDPQVYGFFLLSLAETARDGPGGERWLRAALEHLEHTGSLSSLAQAHRLWGHNRLNEGDLDSAEGALRRSLGMFHASGNRRDAWSTRLDLARIARARGNLDEAERGLRAFVNWTEAAGYRVAPVFGYVNLGLIARTRHDGATLMDLAKRIDERLAGRQHKMAMFGPLYRALGAAFTGDRGQARSALDAAIAAGLHHTPDPETLRTLRELREAAQRAGWPALVARAARQIDIMENALAD
jgi:serine/threonine protein kinase/tetratricopeptide (TPR) repeat protein